MFLGHMKILIFRENKSLLTHFGLGPVLEVRKFIGEEQLMAQTVDQGDRSVDSLYL